MKTKVLFMAVLLLLLAGSTVFAGPYTEAGIQGFVDGDVNPVFVGWATGVVDYSPAPGVNAQWLDPTKTLGAVTGNNFDVASLGDLNQTQIDAWFADPVNNPGPGEITLSFATGITNGTGDDFAVFENGFISNGDGGLFAELAYVEVSTDGTNFARFDSVSLTSGLAGGYGTIDPTDVHNLAGKHPNAYGTSEGTGFNLEDLLADPLITSGLVDINDINYLRLMDIPGSGDFFDSAGNPIYDAWVTWGSGGVDLEAVGVINAAAVPIPAALWLLGSGLACIAGLRRKRQRD